MRTAKDLKERFIDFLYDMKLDSMNMQELSTYSYIVKTIDEMERPGYAEVMTELCKSGFSGGGFGGASDKSKEEE